jgi:thymidylate synthase ThyX
MTHRVFSRNASSSRAIPVKRMIEQVDSNPVVPPKVYMNKAGMVGDVEAPLAVTADFYNLWLDAASNAVEIAKNMEKLGIHKQHINRILEPFQFIKVIVTATDWYNFFVLRLAPDAQPEMRELANTIYDEMNHYHNKAVGVLELDKEHTVVSLPYITDEDVKEIGKEEYHTLMKISAARCARVSYNNHDGSKPDIEKDLKLYGHLYDSKHMSPMEHTCIRDEDHRKNANLTGWKSLRYLIETYEDL